MLVTATDWHFSLLGEVARPWAHSLAGGLDDGSRWGLGEPLGTVCVLGVATTGLAVAITLAFWGVATAL